MYTLQMCTIPSTIDVQPKQNIKPLPFPMQLSWQPPARRCLPGVRRKRQVTAVYAALHVEVELPPPSS